MQITLRPHSELPTTNMRMSLRNPHASREVDLELGFLPPARPVQAHVPAQPVQTALHEPITRAKIPITDDSTCIICFENVSENYRKHQKLPLLFGCDHPTCFECIRYMMQDHLNKEFLTPASFRLTCPYVADDGAHVHCPIRMSENAFEHILGREGHELWTRKYLEANLKTRVYCSNRRCSKLLINHSNRRPGAPAHAVICEGCQEETCIICKTQWHENVSCIQNRSVVNEDDNLFEIFVNRQGYQRCTACGATVSKTSGCNSMRCRCGHSFCYLCGQPDAHGLTRHRCLPAAGAVPGAARPINNRPRGRPQQGTCSFISIVLIASVFIIWVCVMFTLWRSHGKSRE